MFLLQALAIAFMSISMACTQVASDVLSVETPRRERLVLTYNEYSKKAAEDILDAGGNAFDAFIAATMVEYVTFPGITTPAGILTGLAFLQSTGETVYLDGAWKTGSDPESQWRAGDPIGKAIFVPGAFAALYKLSQELGSLGFKECLRASIRLAKDGFRINKYYAKLIDVRRETLFSSEYGKRTFFPDGNPLIEGDTLKQPVLAEFLERLASRPNDPYAGKWAKNFVDVVQNEGGKLTAADLQGYRALLVEPLRIGFSGFSVHTAKSRGGFNNILALKLFEHLSPDRVRHFSGDIESLIDLIQLSRYADRRVWSMSYDQVADQNLATKSVAKRELQRIWREIKNSDSNPGGVDELNHSSHIIVSDAMGNVMTGTHTINSFPWGDGLFVEGVPLTNVGKFLGQINLNQSTRIPTNHSPTIITINDKFHLATGAFNRSLSEANFQFVVNALYYSIPPKQNVDLPRFGDDSGDLLNLDERLIERFGDKLEDRNINIKRDGFIDIGNGGVLQSCAPHVHKYSKSTGCFTGAFSRFRSALVD